MSAYANDRRVEREDQIFADEADWFRVWPGNGDVFNVTEADGGWFARHAMGSLARAHLRTRDEVEDFVESAKRGPFPTADDAIHDLIGDPR